MFVIAILAGFYMAWNIGANDVGNAFGMSVGSGALTLRRAIFLAGVFEFCGAFFVGAPVATTISSKIIIPSDFLSRVARPEALGIGMVAALLGSSIWLNIATFFGQPVSTTHAIIGAVIGFGTVAAGPACIRWSGMGTIAASWVVSPVIGGMLAYCIYRFCMKRVVMESHHPVHRALTVMPIALGGLVAIVAFSIVYKGLPGLRLDLPLRWALPLSLAAGVVVLAAFRVVILRRRRRHGSLDADRYEVVERWFGYMQVPTACYMAFAHGANDVANAIGPVAGAIEAFRRHQFPEHISIGAGILAFGGVGIVVGLATYGYKVIESLGKRITEITPTRGFSADFATATTVLVFSKLGMPISTTFVIVGAVMGVGIARGFGAIDLKVIRRIFASWLVTIPISAVLTAVIYWTLMALYHP